jgi:hypothetical protein
MFKKNLVTLTLLGAITACQTTSNVQEIQSTACFFPDAPKTEAPQWVCGVTPEDMAISSTGFAKKNIAGLSVMNDMSTTDARSNLGRQFEVSVQSIIKTAVTSETNTADQESTENVKEYFEKITKNVSSTTLNNSRIITRRSSPKGGLYTLIGMDQATFDLNMNKIIQKASAKDAELWNKFNDKKTGEALTNVLSKLQK